MCKKHIVPYKIVTRFYYLRRFSQKNIERIKLWTSNSRDNLPFYLESVEYLFRFWHNWLM